MEGSNPFISLGDLSKPANTLIEKISDAIGGIFKPYQIKRVAEAEAQADKIKAVTKIEITELQLRATQRFFIEEANKQNNIENITSDALGLLEKESKPQNIDDDWIINFFDKARLISNEQMQKLWAKVLSGEANTPGTYSKKTIDILSSLSQDDAELFTKFCSYCFTIDDDSAIPMISGLNNQIFTQNNIDFPTIVRLESFNLIKETDNALGGYGLNITNDTFTINYFDKRANVELKNKSNKILRIGEVIFTHFGEQLAKLTEPKPVEGFFNYVLKHLEKQINILDK